MQTLKTPPDLKGYVVRNSVLQFSFVLHVYSGSELIEFVRYYEPLFLRPHSSWETQDKLASTFHFRAHRRLVCSWV